MSCVAEDNLVEVKVLFFAKAREISGLSSTTFITEQHIHVSKLLNQICQKFAVDSIRDSCVIAINECYCDNLVNLQEGDEVAIIPAISGG
ncbi:molybdopterin synthase sulfur carrier subunit [Bactrocera neohumeralis]|uniref:molybdopterin synthase sulfur carrier subunit n=1 Tax=Bactrocera tryoni TaxID=59916 RepID=UPI001A97AD09|nr:molybdopterin synthase sulfur carrier subunit [Bactrocera tryoni]XP_039950459.1 molybdopterin synthase sulfur carrier subunit [Bactrocera tryoni]XP_050319649.1 molybdopterin synthase sulfur carrier subunit [Bactrocera neohumeralis]